MRNMVANCQCCILYLLLNVFWWWNTAKWCAKSFHRCNITLYVPLLGALQRCGLGLERLGLETVSRRFLERLGLEDITSRSRVSGFVTLGLVNIHAMHQACGYVRKKIMDLTRKKQVVKWQLSPVIVFSKLLHCGLETFCGTSRSRLGLEGWTSRSRLGLVT